MKTKIAATIIATAVATLFSSLALTTALAGEPVPGGEASKVNEKEKAAAPSRSDEEARRQDKAPVLTPPSSKEDTAKLEALRNQINASGCGGQFPQFSIAFSATNRDQHNSGQDVLCQYPNTVLNETGSGPAAWDGATFCAPCPGLYYFAVDFVKDTAYAGGTSDDVMIYIALNGAYKGSAWAGEMMPSTRGDRSTGAYHVILRLVAGDIVRTYAHSDGGPMWHIYNANFSGHRIGN